MNVTDKPITRRKAKELLAEFDRSGLDRAVVNMSKTYDLLPASLFLDRLYEARDTNGFNVDIKTEGKYVVIERGK